MSYQDAVKQTLPVSERNHGGSTTDATTPTTPRPNARFADQHAMELARDDSTSSTPTHKDNLRLHDQRPSPDDAAPTSRTAEAKTKPDAALIREESRHSVHSVRSNDDSEDVEMADDDEGLDGQDMSDNDSVNSDSQRPSKKKKKGQRFYCTDFPPCQLSFTRSEHLARHIRKHTGERPFQCHCSRRFSRLDNLRQHAQTVHVNEEIPGDSLAATGTRFQRQIRTDRVRPTTNPRPRASTASSHGGHSRGHSRNLSASSIASSTSNMSLLDDVRPRPPPLAISQDGAGRARMSLDNFNPAIGNAGTQYGIFQQSLSGYSTPTTATFSTGPTSPQFSAGMPSPASTISRSSFYNGTRTPSRRLSVPAGPGSYPSPTHGSAYPPVYFSPVPPPAVPVAVNAGSVMASPAGVAYSHGRRESDADLEWRRRTWHPGTQSNYAPRPATSGLSYHQTPDDAAPALSSQPAASQITRLPGIESFDHAPPPPAPARNVTSPVQVDHMGRRVSYVNAGEAPVQAPDEQRQQHAPSDAGLHQNLTRLDIGTSAGSRISWPEQARQAQVMRPTTAPHTGYQHPQQQFAQSTQQPLQPPAEIMPGQFDSPVGERDRARKRQAWYGGPVAPPQSSQPIMIAHRTSPESSSSDGVPTPSTSHGREMHPAIRHANGMVEMQPPGSVLTEEQQQMMRAHYGSKPEPIRADSGFHSYGPAPAQGQPTYVMHSGHDMQMHHGYMQAPPRPNNDMGRLEALVAVATSENRAVEHRS